MKIIAAVPFPLESGGEIIPANEPGFHNIIKSLGELGQMTARAVSYTHLNSLSLSFSSFSIAMT